MLNAKLTGDKQSASDSEYGHLSCITCAGKQSCLSPTLRMRTSATELCEPFFGWPGIKICGKSVINRFWRLLLGIMDEWKGRAGLDPARVLRFFPKTGKIIHWVYSLVKMRRKQMQFRPVRLPIEGFHKALENFSSFSFLITKMAVGTIQATMRKT